MRHRTNFPPSHRIHRWILAAVFAALLVVVGYALVVLAESVVGGLLSQLRSAHLIGR